MNRIMVYVLNHWLSTNRFITYLLTYLPKKNLGVSVEERCSVPDSKFSLVSDRFRQGDGKIQTCL